MKFLKMLVLAGVMALFAMNANAYSLTGAPGKGKFVTDASFTLSEDSSFEATMSGITGGFELLDENENVLFSFGTISGADKALTGTLLAGDYSIFFFGKSTLAGAYSFITTALPVPEANTAGMMITGLGMLGFIAMRRRNTI